MSYLTPSTQGIHLPASIFSYMNSNFFSYICQAVSANANIIKSGVFSSQAYLSLDACECKGADFSGMPTIDLLANKGKATTLDADSNYYYVFQPSEFELFPKVNALIRITYCNLGLWNLKEQYSNITQPGNLQNEWALG